MNLQPPDHWARDLQATVPHRRADIVDRALDGGAVLYDPRTGRTHRMNRIALTIWRACDGRSSSRELAEALTQNFDVSLDTALDDVEQSIALFARAGLVTEAVEP